MDPLRTILDALRAYATTGTLPRCQSWPVQNAEGLPHLFPVGWTSATQPAGPSGEGRVKSDPPSWQPGHREPPVGVIATTEDRSSNAAPMGGWYLRFAGCLTSALISRFGRVAIR